MVSGVTSSVNTKLKQCLLLRCDNLHLDTTFNRRMMSKHIPAEPQCLARWNGEYINMM